MRYILFCFSPFGPFQSNLLYFGLLGHFGVLCANLVRLGSFGPLWVTLVLWAILGYFGRLGHFGLLQQFGPLWVALVVWATFFWSFEPVCVASLVLASLGFLSGLGHFGLLWQFQGHFGPHRATSVHLTLHLKSTMVSFMWKTKKKTERI